MCRAYAPRTVVLRKSPEGYGFVLRGAKCKYGVFENSNANSHACKCVNMCISGCIDVCVGGGRVCVCVRESGDKN